jgi:hypothetical protein
VGGTKIEMATAFPTDRGRTTPAAAPAGERRDPTIRALRNAVAAWFRIHPSSLSVLDRDTVEHMALRLEGQRPRRALPGSVCPVPEGSHPWAG